MAEEEARSDYQQGYRDGYNDGVRAGATLPLHEKVVEVKNSLQDRLNDAVDARHQILLLQIKLGKAVQRIEKLESPAAKKARKRK